jgi:hypothetical protein
VVLPGQGSGRLLLQVTPSREGHVGATGQGEGLLALPILQREERRYDAMCIARYGQTRYWVSLDADDTLVCPCVYRKGTEEVVRCLTGRHAASKLNSFISLLRKACAHGLQG